MPPTPLSSPSTRLPSPNHVLAGIFLLSLSRAASLNQLVGEKDVGHGCGEGPSEMGRKQEIVTSSSHHLTLGLVVACPFLVFHCPFFDRLPASKIVEKGTSWPCSPIATVGIPEGANLHGAGTHNAGKDVWQEARETWAAALGRLLKVRSNSSIFSALLSFDDNVNVHERVHLHAMRSASYL